MSTDLSFLAWMAVVGGVLMTMALSSAYLQRLPVSSAAIYLAVGAVLGSSGVDVLRVHVPYSSLWFERVTEVAVVVALFVGGLKLRQPLRWSVWAPALWLAGPVMVGSIACVGLFARLALGLAWAPALLLGAILAPTDPVLASAVSVSHAKDADRLRFALSGEAGLNDGMALPFVLLAMGLAEHGHPGGWLWGWALHRLAWAVGAGLGLGFVLGKVVGRLDVWLRARQRDTSAPTDFLALSLIALSYAGAEAVGALGFLATFAAGVGLRYAELSVVEHTPHPEAPPRAADVDIHEAHPPAEDFVPALLTEEHAQEPAVAAGMIVSETLSFGDSVERLMEVSVIVLVGASVARHWDPRAVGLAALLFLVVRPLLTRLALSRTQTSNAQRWLLGWFGVRGIGSLYYLSYALRRGVFGAEGHEVADLTISLVVLSVIVHGVSATPLLRWYEAENRRRSRLYDRASSG